MPCTLRRPTRSRAHRDGRLGPGRSAAPDDDRLVLLPSGPDTVRGSSLRGTRSSTSHRRAATENGDLERGFSPAGADCRLQGTASSPPSTAPRRIAGPVGSPVGSDPGRRGRGRTAPRPDRGRAGARSSGRRRPGPGRATRPSRASGIARPFARRVAPPGRRGRPCRSAVADGERLVARRVAGRGHDPDARRQVVVAGDVVVVGAGRVDPVEDRVVRSCARRSTPRPGRRWGRPGTARSGRHGRHGGGSSRRHRCSTDRCRRRPARRRPVAPGPGSRRRARRHRTRTPCRRGGRRRRGARRSR